MKSIKKIFVNVKRNEQHVMMLVLLLFITNFVTFFLMTKSSHQATEDPYRQYDRMDYRQHVHHASHNPTKDNTTTSSKNNLYLSDQAETYVYDMPSFETKVRDVAKRLEIPPEWLMAVMHSESRFDASVKNIQGSGATGLIQFMPTTAKDYEITVDKLRNLNHVDQMEFVFEYLNNKRQRYGGFNSLTDLYLAILYPKALGGGPCFELYATPSKAYTMNKGLDENKDGRVTASDIDRRMQRKYKTAYFVDLEQTGYTSKKGFFSGIGATLWGR